jgi:hypothetical protein
MMFLKYLYLICLKLAYLDIGKVNLFEIEKFKNLLPVCPGFNGSV